MYQIGLFSRINHITTKTLRHWDQIGLLKPASVDEVTAYRYYTSDQLPRLHKILALRQLGLSLTDIKEVIENPVSIELLLKAKKLELHQLIKEQHHRLGQVNSWLDVIRGDKTMNYSVILKSLPGVMAATMRTRVPTYDTYFDVVPKMGEEMKRQGAVCAEPAYCFTIYHDGEYREKDIDVEVCEAVVKSCEDSEMVQYKRIDAVTFAACILHQGAYSTIGQAYAFAFNWIKANGYEPAGPPRESYIDGIWNKDDESEWLTELQIPVLAN